VRASREAPSAASGEVPRACSGVSCALVERASPAASTRRVRTPHLTAPPARVRDCARIPASRRAAQSQPFDAIKGKHPDEWQIVNAMLPRKYLPRLANNVYERRAAAAAAQLFQGTPMALDYDQLLNKRPGKAGAIFAWHQDMAYWPKTPDTRTVTFSLAVDATTKLNGALKFLSGSGLARVIHPHVPVGKSRDDTHAVAVAVDEKDPRIEMAEVARGDVTIHDEYVVHGSGGNLSSGTRRTYVVAFRTQATVDLERKAGFTHSHTDTCNWDTFPKDGLR
jgi:hypothetical protein